MKSNPHFSARYSSFLERGQMSGEPDIGETVSHHHRDPRLPPLSPTASLRRNSLHSPDISFSFLRRSSTTESPYYSSPSHLPGSLRRSATNQSHHAGSSSETPVSHSRLSSLLDDKHERGWGGTLPRRNSKQFQHDDIKF